MGYEHREDAVGGAGNVKHTYTHTHSVPRDTQGGWSLMRGWDSILKRVSVAPPLIKLMGNEHLEYAECVWGSENGKHKNTHTHTHSFPRDTQDGCSTEQGSDGILTHGGVAPLLI